MTMARVVSIVNPVAGKAKGAKLRVRAVEELKRLFPDIAFFESNAPGHATVLAQAAKDAELIIAVGGDGTVREVVCGLMSGNPDITTKAQSHKAEGMKPERLNQERRPSSLILHPFRLMLRRL